MAQRLIDANAMLAAVAIIQADETLSPDMRVGKILLAITEAQTVAAAPVVHGEWSTIEDDYTGLIALQCSECNQEYWFEDEPPLKIYNYCPNCGALTDGKGTHGR